MKRRFHKWIFTEQELSWWGFVWRAVVILVIGFPLVLLWLIPRDAVKLVRGTHHFGSRGTWSDVVTRYEYDIRRAEVSYGLYILSIYVVIVVAVVIAMVIPSGLPFVVLFTTFGLMCYHLSYGVKLGYDREDMDKILDRRLRQPVLF